MNKLKNPLHTFNNRALSLVFMLLFSPSVLWATQDEITFFNVGQGHCTLIRRVGYVPLLIDAGSNQNVKRVKSNQEDKIGSVKGEKVIGDIVNKIKSYWNDNNSPKGVLNVVVTHGDKDHVNYIYPILNRLKNENNQSDFRLLLGGVPEHYQKQDQVYRKPYNQLFAELTQNCFYSSHYPRDPNLFGSLFEEGAQLGYWGQSGCITHLYCPLGQHNTNNTNLDEKKNTWSLIIRAEINRESNPISVIITGDGEEAVQQSMLSKLGPARYKEIQSDILLYPHHGAHSLCTAWAQLVNPRAVVISAGNHGRKNGKKGGYYHPRQEAISSLFAGMGSPLSNITHQMHNLILDAINTRPLERLWDVVDSHRIVYYDESDQLSASLRSIFPALQFRLQAPCDSFLHEWKPFEFESEDWYIALEPGWKCAQLNFPIYTTYTSGTMVFKKKPCDAKHFAIEFLDIPTDIELMAQAIQGNLIGEERRRTIGDEVYSRVNGVLDDTVGDYSDFLRMSPTALRASFQQLQAFHQPRLGISNEQAIKHARQHASKIFFLSFNIIPAIETSGNKDQIRVFREHNLVKLLDYFRNTTMQVNFSDSCERHFFDHVVDHLFADAAKYQNFKLVKEFQDRVSIFNAFIQSPHYHDLRRLDWLYLYCLIYNSSPQHRPFLTGPLLTDYAQRLSIIPFYQASGEYPESGLEDILEQAKYFYYQCSGSQSFFCINLAELPDLIHALYMLKLDWQGAEVVADFLSWLPRSLNTPIQALIREVAPFAPHLLTLNKKNFKSIGHVISKAYFTAPNENQMEVVKRALADSI